MIVAAQSAASTATAITAVTAKVMAFRRPMAVRCPQSGHRATSWSKSMPQASHSCSSGCPVGSAVTTRKLANPISSARRAELAFSLARPCWGGTVAVWRKLTRTSLAMILLVAAACGDGSGSGAANQGSTTTRPFDDTSTSADTTTTAAATTTTDPDAVPTELIGAWRSELDDPNVGRVCLSLGARNYSINFCAHPGGGGTASVTGDTITFVSSMTMACPDGEGVYRWQIEDDRLTFTELEPPDPCVDRRDKLAVGDFTR